MVRSLTILACARSSGAGDFAPAATRICLPKAACRIRPQVRRAGAVHWRAQRFPMRRTASGRWNKMSGEKQARPLRHPVRRPVHFAADLSSPQRPMDRIRYTAVNNSQHVSAARPDSWSGMAVVWVIRDTAPMKYSPAPRRKDRRRETGVDAHFLSTRSALAGGMRGSRTGVEKCHRTQEKQDRLPSPVSPSPSPSPDSPHPWHPRRRP